MPSETTEIILKGISGAPGICIGKAYLVDKEGVDVVEKYAITNDKVKKEVNRFKSAVTRARNELSDIIKGVSEELRQHAGILETHLILLKDKMLYGKAIDIIKNKLVNTK